MLTQTVLLKPTSLGLYTDTPEVGLMWRIVAAGILYIFNMLILSTGQKFLVSLVSRFMMD